MGKPSDLLIFSAAYIGDEMSAEFGLVPPSFLPLGGKRLFEHQAQLASGDVYISLPDDFDIPVMDKARLDALNIKVLPIEAGLNLQNSALRVLESIESSNPVEVIFGDTLVDGPSATSDDLVSYQEDPAHHFWSYYSGEDSAAPFVQGFGNGITDRRILCGHFRFGSPDLLKQCLTKAEDFVGALNLYEQSQPFEKRMVEKWYDFGHLSLYHQSKRNFSVARSFNSIESDGKSVRKSSDQTNKIRAEAFWYENLPMELKLHAPKFLGTDDQRFQAGYRMEYVYLPLLSDLFVFGNLPGHVWSQILGSCFEFLKIAQRNKPPSGAPENSEQFAATFFDSMYVEKTNHRLLEFLTSRQIHVQTEFAINTVSLPPIGEIVSDLLDLIRPTMPADVSFLHGDFFFGNSFFDFRSTHITVIDPRAMLQNGAHSMFGDCRYDLAKLAHSVIGRYDHIINGRSALTQVTEHDWRFDASDIPSPEGIEDLFFKTAEQEFQTNQREILAMTALLFLAMLPLHADSTERQDHLFANALRLAADALVLQ